MPWTLRLIGGSTTILLGRFATCRDSVHRRSCLPNGGSIRAEFAFREPGFDNDAETTIKDALEARSVSIRLSGNTAWNAAAFSGRSERFSSFTLPSTFAVCNMALEAMQSSVLTGSSVHGFLLSDCSVFFESKPKKREQSHVEYGHLYDLLSKDWSKHGR